MGRLEGKAAIIAGGSKGIGYAISTTFAREGASVAVVGSNAEAAEKTAPVSETPPPVAAAPAETPPDIAPPPVVRTEE